MSDSQSNALQVDFMGKRLIAMVLSGVVLAAALGSLSYQGLNLGLDFTGGSLVEVKLAEKVDPQTVRGDLVDAGFTNGTVSKGLSPPCLSPFPLFSSSKHLLPTEFMFWGAITRTPPSMAPSFAGSAFR